MCIRDSIICGDEYNKLKDMVAQYEDKFDKISIGRPLLTYIDDYRETVEAVKKDLDKMDIDEAVVFMGHGTEHESHSSYPAIEYMFRDYVINAFVGTVAVSYTHLIKSHNENQLILKELNRIMGE